MRASFSYLALTASIVVTAACGEKGDIRPTHGDDSFASAGSNAGGASGLDNHGQAGASDPVGELIYGFDDEDVDDWDVLYTSSADSADLIDPGDVEVSWNEADGNPGGALEAGIPFDAPGQYVGFGIAFSANDPIDLTGRTVSADVKIVSGVGDEADLLNNWANTKIYIKTGQQYVYANGNLTPVKVIGEWITARFVVDSPAFVDEANGLCEPDQVVELGVQFDTAGTSQSATPGVILIDNIRF